MKVMKWLCAVALVGGCAVEDPDTAETRQGLGSGGDGIGSPVFQSVLNGSSAGTGFWDGQTSGSLMAFENGTGPSRVAFLHFAVSGPDPSSEVCYSWGDPWWGYHTWCYYTRFMTKWGYGSIPPADFTVSPSADSARLHTTTGASFFVETCTYSSWYWWDWQCSQGGSETFDLAWKEDGFMGVKRTGSTEFTQGPYTFRESGTYTQRSARVNGTGVGHTFENGFGAMDRTSGAAVTRDIFKRQP